LSYYVPWDLNQAFYPLKLAFLSLLCCNGQYFRRLKEL
jgi:hypothetical protein